MELLRSNSGFGVLLKPYPGSELSLEDLSTRAVQISDSLHGRLESTQKPDTGHPAETALEQLLTLIAAHPDGKLPKWVLANAKHCKLSELVSYLGADIETP